MVLRHVFDCGIVGTASDATGEAFLRQVIDLERIEREAAPFCAKMNRLVREAQSRMAETLNNPGRQFSFEVPPWQLRNAAPDQILEIVLEKVRQLCPEPEWPPLSKSVVLSSTLLPMGGVRFTVTWPDSLDAAAVQ